MLERVQECSKVGVYLLFIFHPCLKPGQVYLLCFRSIMRKPWLLYRINLLHISHGKGYEGIVVIQSSYVLESRWKYTTTVPRGNTCSYEPLTIFLFHVRLFKRHLIWYVDSLTLNSQPTPTTHGGTLQPSCVGEH